MLNSSRLIGGKRLSLIELVKAYSRNPECKFISENVPMQPRKRRSRPICQVTNNGLKNDKNALHLVSSFLSTIAEDGQALTRHRW